MTRAGKALARRQQGVVLPMLLWFIAALTLLVTGVVSHSKTDVRVVDNFRNRVEAEAITFGVLNLVMRDLYRARQATGGELKPGVTFERESDMDGYQTKVSVVPVVGLVGLNSAGEGLLRQVLERVTGIEQGRVEQIMEGVLSLRQETQPATTSSGWTIPSAEQEGVRGFTVVEDLLKVPGVTREIYDGLRNQVHAQAQGGTAVDLLAAPAEVLLALAGGDSEVVDLVMADRQDGQLDSLPAGFANGLVAVGSGEGGSVFRIDVKVKFGPSAVMKQRFWASLASAPSGIPWRIERAEPVIATSWAESRDSY